MDPHTSPDGADDPADAQDGTPAANTAGTSAVAPTPLLVAAGVVALEGAFAFVFGLVEAFSTSSSRAVMGATTAIFFVAYGAGLLLCAWGLRAVRTWARGPVLLAQLMSLGLAWNFREGGTAWISVVLMVPAVVALVGMLHPRTVAALNE